MMDRCIIHHKDGTFTETVCGLEMVFLQSGDSLSSGMHYQTIDADARLRLPVGVLVHPKDEIEVTHRFGAEINPHQMYKVVQFAESGSSGQRVFLKARTW